MKTINIKLLKMSTVVMTMGLLAGCANMSDTEKTTLTGTGIGAVAGAGIGAIVAEEAATGALVGGVAGAAVGAVAGYSYATSQSSGE